MSVSYPVKNQVWGAAGAHCCKCRRYLLINAGAGLSSQGEVAHIEGENDGAKRYNSNQSEADRNSFSNLMLMCPNCHTEIDNDELTFPTPLLVTLKADHERWVIMQLGQASSDISFAELQVVLKYLLSNNNSTNGTDLKLITPSEKISKNNLSNAVGDYITMGMIRTELVKDYLNRNPDVNFANRLREGFVSKYQELKAQMSGDELFYALLRFACGDSAEFANQAAALAVVVYFFQICDIFES